MSYNRSNSQRSRRTITVIIREDANDVKYHHNGVNALQFDPIEKRLYSAGRDSVIRAWNVGNSSLAKHQLTTHSMEHHCDWVNDIVLCMNGKNIVSASSDCTVKVWNVSRGFCMSTLRTHRDYVKCLAYASHRQQVASAGLDRQIFLWDVGKLLQLTATNNTINTQNLLGAADSIYSLDMNPIGTVCVAGTSQNTILAWDPRTQNFLCTLKGHSDIVKTVVLSPDGTKVLSGSSDGYIKLWCLGQQSCIETFTFHHPTSVWNILTDPGFTTMYSADRDGCVFQTDLTGVCPVAPSSTLSAGGAAADEDDDDNLFTFGRQIIKEQNPILSMQFGDIERKSLWIATTAPHVNKWDIPSENATVNFEDDDEGRYETIPGARETPQAAHHFCSGDKPVYTIAGKPSLMRHHVVNNKRHVLTQDSLGVVCKWDVLLGRKESVIGKVASFDEEIKRHFQFIFVPSWFSVDLKTGYLCVHVDELDCLHSWVPIKELGLKQRFSDGPEPDKVHYTCLLLQALLERWPPSSAMRMTLEHHNNTSHMSPLQAHSHSQGHHPHHGEREAAGGESHHSDVNSSLCSSIATYLGNNYFSLPDHTIFIVNEMPSGKAISRFLVPSCERDVEAQNLKDILPEWIKEIVIEMVAPKFHKLAFFLLPHPQSTLKICNAKKDRLSANDLLPVQKILEHVAEKILRPETVPSPNSVPPPPAHPDSYGQNQNQGAYPSGMSAEELNQIIEGLELVCNDIVLELHWDLRTIKHFIWRGCSGDLTLFFKQKDVSNQKTK